MHFPRGSIIFQTCNKLISGGTKFPPHFDYLYMLVMRDDNRLTHNHLVYCLKKGLNSDMFRCDLRVSFPIFNNFNDKKIEHVRRRRSGRCKIRKWRVH